jgi:invasion protein IalB
MTAIVSVPAQPVRRAVTCIAAVTALTLGTSLALAQTQPAPAPTQPVPAPKATPRPVQPAQKAPAKQPQQPAQQAPAAPADQQAGAPTDQPPVVYSPWTKFCGKDNAQAKEVCLTVKEARLETGQFLAGAALIEQQGEEKKLFRVTLPLGMQLPQGTRMLLDKEQPLQGRYIVCLPNGCMADFDVNLDFVAKLKKGQQLVLQGINLPGQAASYMLPLADFAKANEGPATDPKKFEEDQKKLQEELQKKAEDARKRLQASPPAGQTK